MGLSAERIAEISTAKLREIAKKDKWSWDEIMFLIRQGGDPKVVVTDGGWTILHFAAQFGYADDISYLVKRGVRIDRTFGKDEKTPLLIAIENDQQKVAKALIDSGADVNQQIGDDWSHFYTALHQAAGKGQTPIVKALLSAGAKVDVRRGSTSRVGGCTPLDDAAEGGHAEIVKLLLDAGANPNAEYESSTPLIDAAWNSRDAGIEDLKQAYIETVRLLIQAGANVNFWSRNHVTPLSATCGAVATETGSIYEPQPFTGASKAVYDLLRAAGARGESKYK